MQLYRFSPITNDEQCSEALLYINAQLGMLIKVAIQTDLPIDTLKIFAHYDAEYTFLRKWIVTIGENDGTSEPSYYVKPTKPIEINDSRISLIGMRRPDPYRSQVGCGDYVVEDYNAFKSTYLGKSPFIREIAHPKFEMLEVFHPDFDVLGYIAKD